MKNTRTPALKVAQGAIIAALYVVLTVIFAPISFGEMQVRISEALTILPMFTPAAIPGLFVGCVLGNLLGGAIPVDVIFGSLATLIGAAGGYLLRKNRWLVPLPTVLSNAVIVPFVLRYGYGVTLPIPLMMVYVAVGEIISCYVLGELLCTVLLRHRSIFGQKEEKTKVRVLIVPKFEIGEMSGDSAGEAQLFYEHYCEGCEEIKIPNSTPTSQFYFNKDNGVGLLVTGSGKAAACMSLMSLLSWEAYDFSDTRIVSVGCGGASTGSYIFGDVILVTAACDYELGHHTDSSELENPDASYTWFPLDTLKDYSIEPLNAELYDKVYPLISDCPLRTTDTTKRVLAANYSYVLVLEHIGRQRLLGKSCFHFR